jgi:hypothetical protein
VARLRNNIDSTPVNIKITFNPDIHTEALQYFLYVFARSIAIKVGPGVA